jgi:uncharacterized membrane protein YdjX (TVP38/TMEM64 family)
VSLTSKIIACFVIGVVTISVYLYRLPLWEGISYFYQLLSDREQIRTFIVSFGMGAPFVFMGIQMLQVIFAPVPGEATGLIGGFLFGTFKGFLYSSIALTIGSCMNFAIGRFMGERYVRKLIPPDKFDKFDRIIKRQGVIVIFILFIFPGFPKDYLCLFLGLSTLSVQVFIFLAGVGRIPGTLILSLQGAYLFEKNYLFLGLIVGACLIISFLAFKYRRSVYLWIEKFNSK